MKGAVRTAAWLFISWVLCSATSYGGITGVRSRQWNKHTPTLKGSQNNLGRFYQWHQRVQLSGSGNSVRQGLVSLMSVLKVASDRDLGGTEGRRVGELPTLPVLAGQLGLDTLAVDVVKADLTQALSVRGPLTLLGPTNLAFTTLPAWLKTAMEDPKVLSEVLRFHVLRKEVTFAHITNELTMKTLLLGKHVRFNVYPNNETTAQCAPLDPVSVDNMASNGVLHELKQVMRVPMGNLVEVAAACPLFKTLVSAVEKAGLDKVLQEDGPFTLFAPTDAAFQKLDPAILNDLLNNKTALTHVLEYHVTKHTYCSVGLASFGQLTTLNGQQINITVSTEALKVNNAMLIPSAVDGSVSNGVIHAIDTVLMPPSLETTSALGQEN